MTSLSSKTFLYSVHTSTEEQRYQISLIHKNNEKRTKLTQEQKGAERIHVCIAVCTYCNNKNKVNFCSLKFRVLFAHYQTMVRFEFFVLSIFTTKCAIYLMKKC